MPCVRVCEEFINLEKCYWARSIIMENTKYLQNDILYGMFSHSMCQEAVTWIFPSSDSSCTFLKIEGTTLKHFLSINCIIEAWFSCLDNCINIDCRWGTTDDVATIPFYMYLSFSSALWESPNPFLSILWCCLPISSSVFLSFLLLSLFPAELSSPFQRILRCCHTI